MATNYNDITVTYDSASIPYNGSAAAVTYTYAGSVTMIFTSASNVQYIDGADVFTYSGFCSFSMLPGSFYRQVQPVVPTIAGVTLALGGRSRVTIRRYYHYKDPVVVAGCPQCGCLLYDQ